MVAIIYCESGYNQFTSKGTVLESYTHDYGLFQINAGWIPKSKELGYDIMTPLGNYKMAKYIYSIQHEQGWVCNRLV